LWIIADELDQTPRRVRQSQTQSIFQYGTERVSADA
jgi:hypothetical protein